MVWGEREMSKTLRRWITSENEKTGYEIISDLYLGGRAPLSVHGFFLWLHENRSYSLFWLYLGFAVWFVNKFTDVLLTFLFRFAPFPLSAFSISFTLLNLFSLETLSSCVWWGSCAAPWWWESAVDGWRWTSSWSRMIHAEVNYHHNDQAEV